MSSSASSRRSTSCAPSVADQLPRHIQPGRYPRRRLNHGSSWAYLSRSPAPWAGERPPVRRDHLQHRRSLARSTLGQAACLTVFASAFREAERSHARSKLIFGRNPGRSAESQGGRVSEAEFTIWLILPAPGGPCGVCHDGNRVQASSFVACLRYHPSASPRPEERS